MTRLDTDRLQAARGPHFGGGLTKTSFVGQRELVEKAAEGRFTEVFLARPAGNGESTSAPYAIKMLRRPWETDARAVQMMRREALLGRLVSHPHLVSILSGSTGTAPYYVVMPWLAGVTLEAKLAGGRPLGVPEAIWITRQIADALDALAAAGWMHGDVKPGNIFISPEGHATLLDLGFARRTGGQEPDAGEWLAGTGQYLAPEALVRGLHVDIRSDLYSLGVTLFEMLSGQPPFTGSTPAELARQHRQARPRQLDDLARRLPVGVAALVREMLAKEPLRRPQTPRDVVERLVRAEIATLAEKCRSRAEFQAVS